ncbi:MAG: DUF4177 domain-containing protein [Pseudomonadota bacterium]
MAGYEYKVIPSPTRGEKARGMKTAEARFAHAIETVMNQMTEDGWEFQRAELLPNEERSGLTGTATTWRNLLVFRRPIAAASMEAAPAVPEAAGPEAEDLPEVSDVGKALHLRSGRPEDAANDPPLTRAHPDAGAQESDAAVPDISADSEDIHETKRETQDR